MAEKQQVHRGYVLDVRTSPRKGGGFHIIVSARDVPKAVVRNKLKRWCREALRTSAFRARKDMMIEFRVRRPQAAALQSIREDVQGAEKTLLRGVI